MNQKNRKSVTIFRPRINATYSSLDETSVAFFQTKVTTMRDGEKNITMVIHVLFNVVPLHDVDFSVCNNSFFLTSVRAYVYVCTYTRVHICAVKFRDSTRMFQTFGTRLGVVEVMKQLCEHVKAPKGSNIEI